MSDTARNDIVTYTTEGRVGIITLNRPDARNAINGDVARGVEAAVDVTLLSRYYERFADHAVSVARRIIHVLTGEPYIDTVLH